MEHRQPRSSCAGSQTRQPGAEGRRRMQSDATPCNGACLASTMKTSYPHEATGLTALRLRLKQLGSAGSDTGQPDGRGRV